MSLVYDIMGHALTMENLFLFESEIAQGRSSKKSKSVINHSRNDTLECQ